MMRRKERLRLDDFGPTHACQKLCAEGMAISPDTLTRRLKSAAGAWVRMRRGRRHRGRGERRACLGEMVRMDGSPHDAEASPTRLVRRPRGAC